MRKWTVFFILIFATVFCQSFFWALSSNRTIKERRAYELKEKNEKEE